MTLVVVMFFEALGLFVFRVGMDVGSDCRLELFYGCTVLGCDEGETS